MAMKYQLRVSGTGHKMSVSVDQQRNAVAPSGRRPSMLDPDGFPVLGPPTDAPEIMTVRGRTRMFFPHMSMKDLAEELSFKLGKPVADMTGLTGTYGVGLYWADDDVGPSLQTALHSQLGLLLVGKNSPVDFLIVQHVLRLPIEN